MSSYTPSPTGSGLAHLIVQKPLIAAVCVGAIGLYGYATTDVEVLRPMVSITFDDGTTNQYDYALPLMNQYGLVGTTYINTGMVADQTGGFYLTDGQITSFVEAGWELGSHAVFHDDITGMAVEDVAYTLEESKRYLEDTFGVKVSSFASPYGEYTDENLETIRQYYDNQLGAWSFQRGLNVVSGFNPYTIGRLDVTDDIPETEVCRMIKTLPDNSWLVLLFHRTDNDAPTPDNRWSIPQTKLDAILGCVAEQQKNGQILVPTVSDAAAVFESLSR